MKIAYHCMAHMSGNSDHSVAQLVAKYLLLFSMVSICNGPTMETKAILLLMYVNIYK